MSSDSPDTGTHPHPHAPKLERGIAERGAFKLLQTGVGVHCSSLQVLREREKERKRLYSCRAIRWEPRLRADMLFHEDPHAAKSLRVHEHESAQCPKKTVHAVIYIDSYLKTRYSHTVVLQTFYREINSKIKYMLQAAGKKQEIGGRYASLVAGRGRQKPGIAGGQGLKAVQQWSR